MMTKIFDILKPIDIFGKQILFTYNKKSNFSTPWGGFISIIILGLIFGYTYFMLLSMYKHDNPNIIESLENYDPPPQINVFADNGSSLSYDDEFEDQFNSVQYPICLIFQNASSHEIIDINQSFFSLQILYSFIEDNNKIEKETLKYSKCQGFRSFSQETKDIYSLNNSYCINQNYKLLGDEFKKNFSKVEINIIACNNTNNSNCQNNTTLANFFNNLNVHLYYTKMIINATNFSFPINEFISKLRYGTIYNYTLLANIFIGANILRSFDSLIPLISNNNTLNAFDVISHTIDYIDKKPDNIILSIKLLSSSRVSVKERSYDDILKITGIAGGLSTIFFYIGSIFVIYISNLKFKESMINDFYSIVDPKNEENINMKFSDYIMKRFKKFKLITVIDDEIPKFDENNGLNKFFDKECCVIILELFKKIRSKNIFDKNNINKIHGTTYFSDTSKIIKEIKMYEIIYFVFKGVAYDKMYYSSWEIICKMFLCCFKTEYIRQKDKIFKYATDKLDKDTDFLSIVRSVQELEIFKKIYLNDDQTNLFNLTATKSFSYMDLEIDNLEKIDTSKCEVKSPSSDLKLEEKSLSNSINIGENTSKKPKEEKKQEENTSIKPKEENVSKKLKVEQEKEKDYLKIVEFHKTLSEMHKDRQNQIYDKKLLKNLNLSNELISDFLVGNDIQIENILKEYSHIYKSLDDDDNSFLRKSNYEILNEISKKYR